VKLERQLAEAQCQLADAQNQLTEQTLQLHDFQCRVLKYEQELAAHW